MFLRMFDVLLTFSWLLILFLRFLLSVKCFLIDLSLGFLLFVEKGIS